MVKKADPIICRQTYPGISGKIHLELSDAWNDLASNTSPGLLYAPQDYCIHGTSCNLFSISVQDLCYSFNPFSPTLFLIVTKNESTKAFSPYWSNPPFFILFFNFLTFGHSGAQSSTALNSLKCSHLAPLGLKGLRIMRIKSNAL